MAYFIGVDVGGTNIVCGLVESGGRLLHKLKKTTEAHLGSDYVLGKIAQMIKELTYASAVDIHSISAVGIGTPGIVNPMKGITVFAGNLNWHDVKVAEQLGGMLGLPVFVDNDVRMYVYGEAKHGAAQGYDHVLGVTLGTGIAAAVVEKGELFYGGGFMAGELGHIVIDGVKYVCGCGMTGCLETVVSATGIARQVRERIQAGERSVILEWRAPHQLNEITAADVSQAYDAGDPLAVDVMNSTGRLLGKGLSYAVTLFSPDIIVIGGGAAMAGERLFQPMREQLKRSVFHAYWDKLAISPASMMDDAGVVGSAVNAENKISGGWSHDRE
jgi:glucokinase